MTRDEDEEHDAREGRDHVHTSQPRHADTGTAAGVGGVTGAAIGSLAGPIGAVVGAAGGMIVGAVAERAMHADDDADAGAGSEVRGPS
jgi:outer membrane lipoprotein SlyB